ncbi:MAG: hypothetical protein AAFZ65_06585 [Planctomycetota bacterium]
MQTSLLAALILAASGPEAPDELAPLTWNGDDYEATELPEELIASAGEAYRGWAAWAATHDYKLTLSADQRVLLVQQERKKTKKKLALIEDVLEYFDELAPLPEREVEEPTGPTSGGGDAEGEAAEDGTWSWEWEDDGGPLETATAVILQLRNEKDQRSVIDKLVSDFPYLEEWSRRAGLQAGFTLERPLCAAWLDTALGQEEWDPDHELINRTTQLMLLRRFGQLPYWLVQGSAWAAEWQLREALYCFPYRTEFVYATEHSAWLDMLKSDFKRRDDEPLALDEITSWRRGVWDGGAARKAFGLVWFLQAHRPGALSELAEALRIYRDEHNRLENADGTWNRIPNWEVPSKEQQRVLFEAAGEDALVEASRFFERGKRYKPSKR